MSDLKFVMTNITSLLPQNLARLRKKYTRACSIFRKEGAFHEKEKCKVYFSLFQNSENHDVSETGSNNVELVFNIPKCDYFHKKSFFS